MFLRILVTVFSGLIFLFSFWKKLREDYTHTQIFTTGFYAIAGAALGAIISDNFFPEWWFWMGLLGSFLGLFTGIVRFKLRIFETFESFVFGALFVITLIFAYHWYANSSLSIGIGLFVLVLLILFFMVLDKHYKRFTWYRSGRVGFTGLSVFGIFFLIRAAVAAILPDVLSFVGNIETILSGVISFIAFLTVFNLARRT